MNPRSIRLTRIHALNWYGYKDSIPVDGNLLLAGITGSGKSILMDLIQFVLVGDLRLVRFNQSATGDRSDRSLKGYVLGDTKQEEAGVTQYMRDAAITYVALEFTWPNGKRAETWGFRVEFAGAGETQGRTTPFFIPAALERSAFLDEEKRPLDFAAFRALVESQTGREGVRGRIYGELSEYLSQMSQPAHLNFDRNVLRSLLPTAMSFTFMQSFNDFCRRFILSADRIDVRDVTESYRAFSRYEKELIDLRDQHERLRGICERYERHGGLRQDAALARYLEAELRHRHAAERLTQAEAELERLREACQTEETRLTELEKEIPALRDEVDRLKQSIGETPEGKLYQEYKRQNAQKVQEVARLKERGRSVEEEHQRLVRSAREWCAQAAGLSVAPDPAALREVERALAKLEQEGAAAFAFTAPAFAEAARKLAGALAQNIAPAQRRLAEVRAELGRRREEVAALERGRLPIASRLLDAINAALPPRRGEPAARHLRELCELREEDERWRPAVEIAFTRKFAVVVAPEDYDAAEKIYHQLREEARGESLLNPEKALQLKRKARPDSLAARLQCTHPVAEAIVSHLFGELVCVDKREELRKHHAAILPDGFGIRGAFVERPRQYDNLPSVGSRGLEQQRAWKEREAAALAAEERTLRPGVEAAEAVLAGAAFQWPATLAEAVAGLRRLPELEKELADGIARLNQIDRARFDDLTAQQAELETRLAAAEQERRSLDQSEQRSALRFKEGEMGQLRSEEGELKARFATVTEAHDVSASLPRLEELRAEMLEKYPAVEVAAARFHDRTAEWEGDARTLWAELVAARRELAIRHWKFTDLPIDSEKNSAYEKPFRALEESEIPDYTEKATRERRSWEQLFRTQVLEKLRHALAEVENTRLLLNGYLKQPVGNNRYRIVKWENPDFAIYHRLLEASALAHEDELFFEQADATLKETVASFLRLLVEQPDSAEAGRLLDYRFYYDYDMEVDDLDSEGDVRATSRVDRQSGKFSGGENQSPYFVAILASYLRAYKRHDTRSKLASLSLVPIDEAFSKLSGERIKDCITKLNGLGLQGVFSMSTGNIPYAFEHCDSLVVVSKEERRTAKRPQVRNIPVTLHKDSPEARRLLGIEE